MTAAPVRVIRFHLRAFARASRGLIRVALVEQLGGDPESTATLHSCLADVDSRVRHAAQEALRNGAGDAAPWSFSDATFSAVPLREHPWFQAGRDGGEELAAFVTGAEVIDVDTHPVGAAAIGWICACLVGVADDADDLPVKAQPSAEGLLLHVPYDEQILARDHGTFVAHNLLEAWKVAARMRSAKPMGVWLLCADVSPEVVTLPSLAAGNVHLGPLLFGLRLPDPAANADSPQ